MIQRTILFADDEAMILDVAQAMLGYLQFLVIPAANGREALQRFEENKDTIDLVILDISMPELDGFTCLRRIRQISEVPVLISSGLSQTITEDDVRHHRAQGILPKPFTLESLQQIVESILPK